LLNDFTEDWEEFDRVATDVTNNFRGVNRVVFAPGEKSLPEEYEYSELPLDRFHSDILREADAIVFEILHREKIHDAIWQMPIVLVPCGRKKGEYSIVLRPVESNEAMTASFYRMDRRILLDMRNSLLNVPSISDVFFDLTNKPPGTIEWE
ncbi:MAG: glutamine-hydrolyzing GMP synthase, partial [Leptospira sp.]|nr:glutamine-hydrolyzing GMP synthase [Leptospira sp.]